jgi:integrase
VRPFARLRKQHGIRLIPVHKVRHMVATLLKALKVPLATLRPSSATRTFSTSQQIYTHVDDAAQRDALTRLNKLLGGPE